MLTRIIIPTKDSDGLPVETNLDKYLTIIAKRFGGYTLTTGQGGWISESGKLIQETVYLVDCDTELPEGEFWKQLAQSIKSDLVQESVYLRQSPLPYPDIV